MKRISNVSLSLLNADKAKWREGCSYVGTFIVFLTLGFLWYWGNLAVYTESYFRHRLGADLEIIAPWVSSLRMVGMGTGLLVAGYLAQVIGVKWTVVVGCILMDSVMFIAIFCLHRSLICFYLSLGLVGGVGAGLVFTHSLQHALSLQPKYQGLVTGCMISGILIGAACLNQFITWYINPANLAPNLFDGHQIFFTQSEILERVPSTFLVLGAIYLACHVVGIFLMRPKGGRTLDANNVAGAEDGRDKPEVLAKDHTSSRIPVETNETSLTIDVSPRHMLTTVAFYVLWFDVLCSEYAYLVLANFYKIYGETQIPDDQFLACLATAQLLASVLMRPISGGLIDSCGVKFSIVALTCVTSIFSNFWYFTPMISRWFFFMWTVMYSCVCCGFYLIFPVATLRLFGNKHFPKNYGIVMSSTILFNLFLPAIMQALVTRYGWFYLFFSVGCVNAVGLVLSILLLPRK